MTITTRPSTGSSLLGGSIELPPAPCRHAEPRHGPRPGPGEPGTVGRVAVVGAGKMGLPLCAQFAGHGWSVIAVDVQADGRRRDQRRVARTSARSPASPRASRAAHAAGRLRATTDAARPRRRGRRRRPHRPGHARRRAAARLPLHGRGRRRRSRPGVHRRLAGHLRDDPAGRRHARAASRRASRRPAASGPTSDFFVAFSPGAALLRGRPRATSPPTPSSSAASGRRRATGRPRSTPRSSTPRSCHDARPRRPSSASSPTRPTAT